MKLTEEQVDKLVSIWHSDVDIHCELWEFLGWSEEDYAKWVKHPKTRPESNLDDDEINFIFSVKGKC